LFYLKAAIVLMLVPSMASAQDCYYSARRISQIDNELANLIAEYPGTHVAFGLCAVGADNERRRTGDGDAAARSFLTCIGAFCFLAGFSNCLTVAERWYSLMTERNRHTSYRQRYC
jgi:hypothetical protein